MLAGLDGGTLTVERLRQTEGRYERKISHVAYPDHRYRTPSGKIELYSERAERIGRRLCADGGASARSAIGVAQFRDDEALGHLIERAEDALDRARADGILIAVARPRARSVAGRAVQAAAAEPPPIAARP